MSATAAAVRDGVDAPAGVRYGDGMTNTDPTTGTDRLPAVRTMTGKLIHRTIASQDGRSVMPTTLCGARVTAVLETGTAITCERCGGERPATMPKAPRPTATPAPAPQPPEAELTAAERAQVEEFVAADAAGDYDTAGALYRSMTEAQHRAAARLQNRR